MSYLVIACEILRPEIELICAKMETPPETIFMEQGLHNEPPKLRDTLMAKIGEIEENRPDLDRLVLGYGLCGRGLCGVGAKRLTLVIPRVHDCIPLFLGLEQARANNASQDSGVFWLSAGSLTYGKMAKHLLETRYKVYEEKFGPKRAEKMIRAENSVFANYSCACHIMWPELGAEYEDLARRVAAEINLEYRQMVGQTAFLAELLAGGSDPEKFHHLLPGMGIDMDTDGNIIAVKNSV